MRQLIENHDVSPETRGDRSQVVESEIFGGIEGRHLDGHDGIGPQVNGFSNDGVDVAFVEEFPGVAIVGDEEETS